MRRQARCKRRNPNRERGVKENDGKRDEGMNKLIVVILLGVLCVGCRDNQLCIIEYRTGEKEEVLCRCALTYGPIFGADTELRIFSENGVSHRQIDAIKKWELREQRCYTSPAALTP